MLLACIFSSHTLVTYPVVQRYGFSHHPKVTVSVLATAFTTFLSLLILAFVVNVKGASSPLHLVWTSLSVVVYMALMILFIPQIGRFAYATKGNAAYVNLFVESEATLRLARGEVKLAQQTAYPWKGGVRIEVTPNSQLSTHNFQLCIRVPGWCVGRPVPSDLYEQVVPGTLDDFRVTVNGAAAKVVPVKGYCVINRAWKAGDVVEVAMNMPVRRVKANDKVAADRGRAAVERGPIIFCAEGIDNGGKVLGASLPLNTTFTEGEVEIASTRMVSLTGGGLTLVPYFAWCHRGAGEMQTWFAESEGADLREVAGKPHKAAIFWYNIPK
jgi:DUF1680 family protein